MAHDRLTNERLGDIQNQLIDQDGKIVGLQTEMRQRFNEQDNKITELRTTQTEHTTHLNRLATKFDEHTALLTQILARLPENPPSSK
jgi:hypothetical protein